MLCYVTTSVPLEENKPNHYANLMRCQETPTEAGREVKKGSFCGHKEVEKNECVFICLVLFLIPSPE